MSSSVIPEVLRNFWKSASLGNDCFLVVANCFSTSASDTVTFCSPASPWIHCDEIRNCMTCCLRPSYCCWHWDLKVASVGVGWPLAGFGALFFFSSMHCLKSGASGTEALAPALSGSAEPADEIAATFIQWSKSAFEMVLSPTFATALPGIESLLPPQA